MKVETLADIVLSLQSNTYENKVVKRAITKAAKGFRPRSSNDVEHHTFLAMCLYFSGDRENAKDLLRAVDLQTAVVEGRADLAGELAIARIFLAHIYGMEGKSDLRKEILNRDDIGDCRNLENIDFSYQRKYENELQEELAGSYYAIKESKFDTSVPKREQQKIAYECYMNAVIYAERLDEFRDKISEDDEAKLADALVFFRDNFSYYLNS